MQRKNHDFYKLKAKDLGEAVRIGMTLTAYSAYFKLNWRELFKGDFYYSRMRYGTCYLFVRPFEDHNYEPSDAWFIRMRRYDDGCFYPLEKDDVVAVTWEAYYEKLDRWITKEGVHVAFAMAAADKEMQDNRLAVPEALVPISARIAEMRQKTGLEPRQLASRLGCSISSVVRWENGMIIPTIQQIIKLARILGTTVEYLVNGE